VRHMAPNLTRVTRFGLVNAYLVGEADGLTLVDTLLPRSAKPILAEAARLGAPIVRIVLTHGHGDHVGSLDALVAHLGDGVEVLISPRDDKLLRKDRAPEPDEPTGAKVRGGVPGTKTRPSGLLAPGDRVGSLEVVASPGHTPGHISLLDTRDRTLIAGDAFSTLGGVATTAKPNPRFPLPGLVTWHRPTALESARALRALDAARLVVGHGKPVEAPGAQMDAAITKAAA